MKIDYLWDGTGYMIRPYTQAELKKLLRNHIKREYGRQATAAKCWGLSPAVVTLYLSGSRKIPDFIAREMGFVPEVVYVKVGK